MKFEVAYRTADGKMAETTVEVADRNAVYSELRRRGISPVSLREASAPKRAKASAPGSLPVAVKVAALLLLLALALFALWYGVIADEGTKRHFRNSVTPATKVDVRSFLPGRAGADAPRRGTGAVSVKIAE
ncbi:MAG: hypothetical protein IJ829_05565 [Kiritimatiellae bacterium]|nr:hypothetical protein [Kiritimatiellia bacterium]